MLYQITIKQRGVIIGTPHIEADSSLDAINQVEQRYSDQFFPVIISTGKHTLLTTKWTGLEFTAKSN